jgi:hypothetical protein
MHNYATATCVTLTEKPHIQKIWQNVVPKIALSHPFLMHGLLALSALQLFQTHPSSPRRLLYSELAMTHQHLALTGFTPMLECITEENCAALFSFSCVITALSFAYLGFSDAKSATDEFKSVIDVFDLLIGSTVIVQKSRQSIEKSPIAPLLRLENFDIELGPSTPMPKDLEVALDALEDRVRASTSLENQPHLRYGIECTDQQNVVTTYIRSIEELRRTSIRAEIHPSDQGLIFCWPVLVDSSYMVLLRKHDPLALIIFAHYGVLLHRIEAEAWFSKGVTARLLNAISEILGPEWQDLLRWPIEKVQRNENGSQNHGS